MQFQVMAEGLNFPEGPVALDDGSVLVVELRSRSLKRIYPDGKVDIIATVIGAPNGAAIGPNGTLYLANNGGMSWEEHDGLIAPGPQPDDYSGGKIQTVSQKGIVYDLYTHYEDGSPIVAPNDLVLDNDGGFYFTDHGQRRISEMDLGALSYGRLDGSSVKKLVSPLFTPNGIGLSPDGKKIYVSETITGRIWWWDLISSGVLKDKNKAHLLIGLGGFTYLDSLAVDEEGNISVATMPQGGITTISPEGQVIDFIQVPLHDPTVTNICFGGENMSEAFITSSGRGRLYRVKWPRKGLKLSFGNNISE